MNSIQKEFKCCYQKRESKRYIGGNKAIYCIWTQLFKEFSEVSLLPDGGLWTYHNDYQMVDSCLLHWKNSVVKL